MKDPHHMTSTADAGFSIWPSIDDALTAAIARSPERAFLRHGAASMTYAEVDDAARRIAAGLARLGVASGDRVAVLMPNSIEHVLTLFACARLGAVQVPLNWEYTAESIARLLDMVEPAVLVTDVQYAALVSATMNATTAAPRMILSDVDGLGGVAADAIRLEDLRAEEPLVDTPAIHPGHPLMLIMTSGTTAAAKAVEISHGFALHLGSEAVWHQGYSHDDVLFSPYPLFHGDAPLLTVMPGLVAGITVAIGRKFSASGFWAEIRSHGATVFDYMGAVLAILGKQPPRDDDADNPVRLAWGGPAPANWRELEQRFGMKIREAYGATECCLPAWEGHDRERVEGAAGRLCEHHDVRIADESGMPVPTGQIGEILVRSAVPHGQMNGYFGNPEATVKVWEGLWYHTGDRGSVDAAGNLRFSGRQKDVIRRRGRNIGAEEIESVAVLFPGVTDAAAIAVPSDLTEDDIKVVLHAVGVTPEGVVGFLRERLPRYMVPRYIEVLDELPRTPTGKVDKNRLRSDWRTPVTWDVDAGAFVPADPDATR
jgi:crotonobetaine/carnitine-CoA ligase